MKNVYDVVVIGGGPAGMAAASRAQECGAETLLIERDDMLGGILNQCIHDGFGVKYMGENLTGPEFAQRMRNRLAQTDVTVLRNAFVTGLTKDLRITAVTPHGMELFQAKSVILSMGCRERTREAIKIPGTRVAGVYTAGMAQRYVNIDNQKPGSRCVILGSGDIGLIMARRLSLEGMKVLGVYELMPEANGLRRNIQNCLNDFGIPLHLSKTVTRIIGRERVEAVEVSAVDENLRPIPDTEEVIPCDTLLLAIGLIPENELTYKAGATLNRSTGGPIVDDHLQTDLPGIFACGNVLHVHDLVDNVAAEAEYAGEQAARYVRGLQPTEREPLLVKHGKAIRYTVPNQICFGDTDVSIRFRAARTVRSQVLRVYSGTTVLLEKKPKDYRPSTMETVVLPKGLFQRCSGTEITLELESGVGS